jgi:hypothetical protein
MKIGLQMYHFDWPGIPEHTFLHPIVEEEKAYTLDLLSG